MKRQVISLCCFLGVVSFLPIAAAEDRAGGPAEAGKPLGGPEITGQEAPSRPANLGSPEDVGSAEEILTEEPVFFAGGGSLGIGPQGCTLFQADSGGSFLLSETGGFIPGDRVFVTGQVNDESTSCFPITMAEIENNTIAECFSGCGTLGWGPQSCIMFHGDHGDSFAVDNTGGFFPGDRVYVTGAVNEESLMCFPIVLAALEYNTIAECVSECGTLGWGPQSCILFHPDSGGGYAVRLTGDYFIGDRVFVTGRVDEDSIACWPVTTPSLEDLTMEPCDDEPGGFMPGKAPQERPVGPSAGSSQSGSSR